MNLDIFMYKLYNGVNFNNYNYISTQGATCIIMVHNEIASSSYVS